MTWVLFLVGLIIAFKGLLYLLSPKKGKDLLMKIWRLDMLSLRIIGLLVLIAGLYIIYLSDFSKLAIEMRFG